MVASPSALSKNSNDGGIFGGLPDARDACDGHASRGYSIADGDDEDNENGNGDSCCCAAVSLLTLIAIIELETRSFFYPSPRSYFKLFFFYTSSFIISSSSEVVRIF